MKSKKSIKSILFMAIIVSIGMFFINMSLAATTGKINVETANLRKEANADSSILEQLSLNEEVEILEKTGEWYQVKYKGMTGFIKQDLITTNGEIKEEITKEEVKEETNTEEKSTPTIQEKQETKDFKLGKHKLGKNTKLRIVPSINATETIEIKQDEEVNVVEIINGWVCVEVNNTKGWIRQDCLKLEDEQPQEEQKEPEATEEENKKEEEEADKQETVIKTQYIGKETVNLRTEPSTSSEIITSYALNTEVEVYAEENGWSKVKISGKEGYISSSLLSDTKQETSRSIETSRRNNDETTATTEDTTAEETTSQAPASTPGVGSSVVETALQYTGYRYVYGGSSPSGFDCSGFTSYIYGEHGVSLNRTAQGQYSNGVPVSRENLQPGDLVMFGTSASNITHVGIYMGGGQIVHAANSSRGVTTDTINSGYYNNKYVGARRVN